MGTGRRHGAVTAAYRLPHSAPSRLGTMGGQIWGHPTPPPSTPNPHPRTAPQKGEKETALGPLCQNPISITGRFWDPSPPYRPPKPFCPLPPPPIPAGYSFRSRQPCKQTALLSAIDASSPRSFIRIQTARKGGKKTNTAPNPNKSSRRAEEERSFRVGCNKTPFLLSGLFPGRSLAERRSVVPRIVLPSRGSRKEGPHPDLTPIHHPDSPRPWGLSPFSSPCLYAAARCSPAQCGPAASPPRARSPRLHPASHIPHPISHILYHASHILHPIF